MSDANMSRSDKEELVAKVADLAMRDVLKKGDAAEILRICVEACQRRVDEIDAELGPVGSVQ